MAKYCWPHCTGEAARRVARFLKCYEGPYANTENLTNPERRPGCMKDAGLNYSKVHECAQNASARSELERIQNLINDTRAPMYATLQPNPGFFPHIFINGSHQWNNSWTSLLTTLCHDEVNLFGNVPPSCKTSSVTYTFSLLQNERLNKTSVESFKARFTSSVILGVNYAASKVALPHHFHTKGEPGNAPSYVNIQAVSSASLVSVEKGQTVNYRSWLNVEMVFQGVLNGNMDALKVGAVSESAAEYIAWALSANTNHGLFGKVTVSGISRQHIGGVGSL